MFAPKGNQYGVKPPDQHKTTNQARIIADLGDGRGHSMILELPEDTGWEAYAAL